MKCAYKISRVGSLIRASAGVMIDHILLIVGVINKFFKLSDIFPGLAEVERTEIFIEIVVDKVLFGIEDTLSMLK